MKRIRVVLFLVISAIMVLSAAAEPPAPLVIERSRLLTEPQKVEPYGGRRSPKVAKSDRGYCVAWQDQRQGGAVLATRIEGGEVQDPYGIPVIVTEVPGRNTQQEGPIAVMASSEGCVVVSFLEASAPGGYPRYRYEGTLIRHGQASETETLFRVPPGHLLAADDRRMILGRFTGYQPHTLRVISSRGETLRDVSIEDPPMAFAFDGDDIYFATHVRESDALRIAIWRWSSLGPPERIGGEIVVAPHATAEMATDGENLLLTVTEYVSGAWRTAKFFRLDLDGKVSSQFSVELPGGGILRKVVHDGVYRAYWMIGYSVYVVETDGESILAQYSIPNISGFEASPDELEDLYLWQSPSDLTIAPRRLTYELTNARPSGEGDRLTSAPPPEVILDSDETSEHLGILWDEIVDDRRWTWVSLSDKSVSGLRPLLVRTEVLRSLGSYAGSHVDDVGVAIAGGVAAVVWVQDGQLLCRRLDFSGDWLDESPVVLRDPEIKEPRFSSHGIHASGDGFVLTWSEWETKQSRALFAAFLGSSGGISEPVRIEFEPYAELPGYAAIAPLGDRFVVTWLDLYLPLCPITCVPPPYRLGAGLLEKTLEWDRSILPEASFTRVSPKVATSGDAALIVAHKAYLLDGKDDMARSVTRGQGWTGMGPSVHASEDGWILAGFVFSYVYGAGPGTRVTTIGRDGLDFPTDHVLVPDWSKRSSPPLPYVPQVFRNGSKLMMIGSEVSNDPESGMVRRLRLHELAKVPRRRSIRRP